MASDISEKDSPMQFPLDFPVKVMGKADATFEEAVKAIVLHTFPTADLASMSKRLSKDNNYLALTIVVHAQSREELDKLYQELSECPHVLMAL